MANSRLEKIGTIYSRKLYNYENKVTVTPPRHNSTSQPQTQFTTPSIPQTSFSSREVAPDDDGPAYPSKRVKITGLIRSGAMKPDDKPIWYNIYQAFPPNEAPKYGRIAPSTIQIKNIFYEEDKFRAKLHQQHPKLLGTINMLDTRHKSNSQRAMEYYREIKTDDMSDDEALERVVERLKMDMEKRNEKEPEQSLSLAESFKEASLQKLDVKKLFES